MSWGKICQCSVSKYDSDSMVFRTGETFCGTVTLHVEGKVTLAKISVKLLGEIIIGEERHKEGEPLINLKSVLLKPEDTKVLTSGPHYYYFHFGCTHGLLPSSIEERYGSLRYWFQINVRRAGNQSYIYKFPLILLADIDVGTSEYQQAADLGMSLTRHGLDVFSACFLCPICHGHLEKPCKKIIQTPMTLTAFKTVPKHLCFGDAGQLHLTASLDAVGFCPGEKISIRLTAKNGSSKDLGHINVILVQKVTFRPSQQITKWKINIRSRNPLLKMSEQSDDNLKFAICAIPPSSIPGLTKYITMEYYLEVYVSIPWKSTLKVTFPITIGTIPAGFQKSLEVRPWGRSDTFTTAVFSPPLEVRPCIAGYEVSEKTIEEEFPPDQCVPMTSFNSSTSVPSIQSSQAEAHSSGLGFTLAARHSSASALSSGEGNKEGHVDIPLGAPPPSYHDLFPSQTEEFITFFK